MRVVTFHAVFKGVVWMLPFLQSDGWQWSLSLDGLRKQLQPAATHIERWELRCSFTDVTVKRLHVSVVRDAAPGLLSIVVQTASDFPPPAPRQRRRSSAGSSDGGQDVDPDESESDFADPEAAEEADGEDITDQLSLASSDETCLSGADEAKVA